MDLSRWPESFPYLAVFVATILEGEVVFVGASVLVSLGHLDPLRVFVAAAPAGINSSSMRCEAASATGLAGAEL